MLYFFQFFGNQSLAKFENTLNKNKFNLDGSICDNRRNQIPPYLD